MRRTWSKLGGRLGMAVVLAGFVVVFLGWNGAASYDRVPAQFPYLISGGIAGLALVVLGSAFIVVDASRRNRAAVLAELAELRDAVDRLASSNRSSPGAGAPSSSDRTAAVTDIVLGGPSSYHRPGCRLLEGRGPMPSLLVQEAQARGLEPCRVCEPAEGASGRGAQPLEGRGQWRRAGNGG